MAANYRIYSIIRSDTKIAPKSPFLCVNRNSTRYDFPADSKVFWYGVNITLNSLMPAQGKKYQAKFIFVYQSKEITLKS